MTSIRTRSRWAWLRAPRMAVLLLPVVIVGSNVNRAQALAITGWRSVRPHSGIGPLVITLNRTATGNGISGPTVETRQGGIQRLEIDFDQPAAISNPSAVSVTGQTTVSGALQPPVDYSASATVASVDGDTIALTFSDGALPDETCYRIDVAGAVTNQQGAALTGDTDCRVRSLLGDATGSGEVNLGDALLTKVRVGQNAAASPQLDFNLTGGTINTADMLLAKNRVASPARKALCPPPPLCQPPALYCGGCVDPFNDSQNCGSCFHACAGDEYCSGGTCVPSEPCPDCGGG